MSEQNEREDFMTFASWLRAELLLAQSYGGWLQEVVPSDAFKANLADADKARDAAANIIERAP